MKSCFNYLIQVGVFISVWKLKRRRHAELLEAQRGEGRKR